MRARASKPESRQTRQGGSPSASASVSSAYVVIISAPQRSVGRSANADALAAALVNAIQGTLGPRQAVVRGLDVRDAAQAAEVTRLLASHASSRKLLSPGGGGLAQLPSPLLYATREGIFTKPGLVSLQLIVDVAEQVLGRAMPPALMRVVLEFPQRHDLRFCDAWANALEAAEAPEARISAAGVGPLGGGTGTAQVGLEAALRAAGYGERGVGGGGGGGGAGAGSGSGSAAARNPQAAAAVAMGGGPIRATPPAAGAFAVMDGYTEMAVYESGGVHEDGGIPIVSDPGIVGGGRGHDEGLGMDDLRAAIMANRSRGAGAGGAAAMRAGANPAKFSIEDRIKTSLPLDAVTSDAQLRERDLIPDTSPAATDMEIAQARRARHAGF